MCRIPRSGVSEKKHHAFSLCLIYGNKHPASRSELCVNIFFFSTIKYTTYQCTSVYTEYTQHTHNVLLMYLFLSPASDAAAAAKALFKKKIKPSAAFWLCAADASKVFQDILYSIQRQHHISIYATLAKATHCFLRQ